LALKTATGVMMTSTGWPKNIVQLRLGSATIYIILDTDYRLAYSRPSSLACLAVVGIIHLDSLSSSRAIYYASLIAIKILLVQPPVAFVVESKQLCGLYHLVGNNGNKIMSMALLIGLVRRTLNHSRILAPTGGTTTMGKAKSSLLQSSRKKLFCPKQTGKIKLGEGGPCQNKTPYYGRVNLQIWLLSAYHCGSLRVKLGY
jgi:hypothetical protein